MLHFCRLWALIETGCMAQGIWALVKDVGDAEHDLKSAPETQQRCVR